MSFLRPMYTASAPLSMAVFKDDKLPAGHNNSIDNSPWFFFILAGIIFLTIPLTEYPYCTEHQKQFVDLTQSFPVSKRRQYTYLLKA
ncbi:hypothetical protein GCM10017161_20080 [Thalassotalea marina]|uniref:Uncharacterized protein n=1 Tax=Thalassotalea marina TaxID=1673741 RepID=A0A919BHJ4_9GAMM|nr:hypothetical protein GCM10017161_20080 [Thalassotalea marina]